MTRPLKVALGLSGGVDSAVTAHLLKAAGHDVTAIFIECWREPGCRAETDRQDALKVALQLGLPFQVLDFRAAYRDQVLNYFLSEYHAGRTPNPDVACNREIKFGLFYNWAMEQDFDAIATGHYAQVLPLSAQKPSQHQPELGLFIAADTHKDQTYFLHQLRADQLGHVIFPIGHLLKTEVRELAKTWQFPVAAKPDSVGICFIGDINVHQFLKDRLGTQPGDIIDETGQVIGQHQGLWFYTIGQRHGFTIDTKAFLAHQPDLDLDKRQLPPLYVVAKRPEANQLVIGTQWQQTQAEFAVESFRWISSPRTDSKLLVRIRHTGELVPCQLSFGSDQSTAQVTLSKELTGISAGQFAVFYKKNTQEDTHMAEISKIQCLGGGVIS